MKEESSKKHIKISLDNIDCFNSKLVFDTELKGFLLDGAIAVSKKEENGGFSLKFYLKNLKRGIFFNDYKKLGIYENIYLTKRNSFYLVNKGAIFPKAFISGDNPSEITVITRKLQNAENKKFDDQILRLIIVSNVAPKFNVFLGSEVTVDRTWSDNLSEVKIKDKSYHIYQYSNSKEKKSYLIIDSLEKNLFQEFKSNCDDIILGFGFVTGSLYGEDYYYQVMKNQFQVDSTSYERKEKSVFAGASPFDPSVLKQYLSQNKHLKVSRNEMFLNDKAFSKICGKINQNKIFKRCIRLIIEGNQTKRSLLSAGIYSIALETITNIICEENEDRISPIPNKNIAKQIRSELKEVIIDNKEQLSEYGLNILEARVNNINTPTNSKKLSKPFELYGLELSNEEKQILGHRNKFLHGTSPFEDENNEDEIVFISNKMLFLLHCLILKYCDYKGHVIDYSSFYQLRRNKNLTSELFQILK